MLLSVSRLRMPSIAEAAASPPPTITYFCFTRRLLSKAETLARPIHEPPAESGGRQAAEPSPGGRGTARPSQLAPEAALPGAAGGPADDDEPAHDAGHGDDPGDAERAVPEPVRRPEGERDAQQGEAREDRRQRDRVPRAQHRLSGHDLPAVDHQAEREDAEVGYSDPMRLRIAGEEREEDIREPQHEHGDHGAHRGAPQQPDADHLDRALGPARP